MEQSALQRYQHKPFIGSSHSWAIAELKKWGASKRAAQIAVLDVGPGSCVMGSWLRENGVDNIYAVEIDQEAKILANTIYKEVSDDVQSYQNKQFDLILLLDVIEHMTAPAEFLRRIDSMLKPGGQILISVPNIAHWSVRLSLLFGSFEYKDRGILDKTHYHFFTRKSLHAMASSIPSFSLQSSQSTIEPIQFILPKWVWDNPLFDLVARFRLKIALLLPGLFAFQHIIVVKKASNTNK